MGGGRPPDRDRRSLRLSARPEGRRRHARAGSIEARREGAGEDDSAQTDAKGDAEAHPAAVPKPRSLKGDRPRTTIE